MFQVCILVNVLLQLLAWCACMLQMPKELLNRFLDFVVFADLEWPSPAVARDIYQSCANTAFRINFTQQLTRSFPKQLQEVFNNSSQEAFNSQLLHHRVSDTGVVWHAPVCT